MVGSDDLKGLFQPKWLYDSIFYFKANTHYLTDMLPFMKLCYWGQNYFGQNKKNLKYIKITYINNLQIKRLLFQKKTCVENSLLFINEVENIIERTTLYLSL